MKITVNTLLGLVCNILFVTLLAGCGGGGGDQGGGQPAQVVLVSIEVTPTNPRIALGTTQQLTATGIYSNNTKQDLTKTATWTSTAPACATVSTAGLASAVKVGSAAITAAMGTVSGGTTLTVTNASLVSIGITPTNPSIALGRTLQLTATGVFTDNTVQDLTTQVAWISSNLAAATIDPATGLAASTGQGSTTVTATLFGKSGSAILTVTSAVLDSIDVTPSIPSIALGTSQQLVATGTFSDNTTEDLTAAVIWSSSNTGVATVSNATGSNGLATAVSAGVTTITATLGAIAGSTDLTVDPATLVSIDISPTDPSTPMGVQQQFSASGNFSDGTVQDLTEQVTWSSSNTGVAAVSNAAGSSGMATPVAPGTAAIIATIDGISSSTTLTVTSAKLVSIAITHATPPANARIALGTSLQFTATGTYTDSSTQDLTPFVAWISSNGAVATVSNAGPTWGLATSVGAGATDITAALGAIVSPPTTLTVTTPASLTSITVTPANTTIFLGAAQQFTALANFSDGTTQDLTTQVTWRSSNKTIAAVSNAFGSNGLATPIRVGSTNISATFVYAGAPVAGTTGLTVSSAPLTGIVITPANPSIAVGKTVQFKATGIYQGGLEQDLTNSVNTTWTSSNTAIATIVNVPKKNKGLAKGVKAGNVTIKASVRRGTGSGMSGTTTLTVK